MRHRKQSFEHFYLTKVALGDCCGCAERVIDWRDIENAAAARPLSHGTAKFSSLQKIRHWLQKRLTPHQPHH